VSPFAGAAGLMVVTRSRSAVGVERNAEDRIVKRLILD
jgi:hypothetical protein